MINEIIKLREEGLSFRKIALELNTTVGKVQYRWNKWMANQEVSTVNESSQQSPKEEKLTVKQKVTDFTPKKGELQSKLVSPRKMILFWDVSEFPKKIIHLFFNRPFEDLVTVFRVYDITDIQFNGKNAHHFYEVSVPYQNGHWFVKGLVANRSYVVELGVYLSSNHFFPLLRSNSVQTPSSTLAAGIENQDLWKFQQYEEHPPKWIDHVSTYSYYGESKIWEEKND